MATFAANRPVFGSRPTLQATSTHGALSTRLVAPLGRLLFAAIFLMSLPSHFNAQVIAHAADQGVPMASLLVPAAGALELVGALMIVFGFYARIGAWLLVLFLVPVTIMMHRFWGLADAQAAMMQQMNFAKNISLLGAALLISYFGAGPFSVDARGGRR